MSIELFESDWSRLEEAVSASARIDSSSVKFSQRGCESCVFGHIEAFLSMHTEVCNEEIKRQKYEPYLAKEASRSILLPFAF